MRELVLISEAPIAKSDNSYAINISSLAKEATVLEHVKEVRLENSSGIGKSTLHPPTLSDSTANLSSVFQDPKDIVDPVKEFEFLQKLRALEESDSEGLNSERPVLGKVSLIRRAKSAVSRTTIDQSINDKHPLFNAAWEKRKPKLSEYESFKCEPDSMSRNCEDENDAGDMPTVDEVKRHMELFHLRRSIPPPSAKLKEAQTGKHSKVRRAKTAKNNK